MRINILKISVVITLLFGKTFAQISDDAVQLNSITTAVPFLLIAPDARGAGMGDVGVATLPTDANATHWNLSKLGFIDKNTTGGVSLSYTPWLRKIVNDMNIAYLSGFYRLNKKFVLASSLKYFDLGTIQYTDNQGQPMGQGNPNELSIDAGLAYRIGENFSLGMAFRYINSNLAAGYAASGATSQAGNSVAADVNGLVRVPDIRLGSMNSNFYFGFNLSNLGSKMSYTGGNTKDFLPTNLRIGPAYEIEFDDRNSLTVTFDLNKLLVPTPPVYAFPEDTTRSADEIVAGEDPNRSVINALFTSWNDAPGDVSYDPTSNSYSVAKGSKFKEEMAEFQWSVGLEYWYGKPKILALRAGYFYEAPSKGDRQYATLGAGLRWKALQMDLSYLMSLKPNNPLANTIRFSLSFNFEKGLGTSAETN